MEVRASAVHCAPLNRTSARPGRTLSKFATRKVVVLDLVGPAPLVDLVVVATESCWDEKLANVGNGVPHQMCAGGLGVIFAAVMTLSPQKHRYRAWLARWSLEIGFPSHNISLRRATSRSPLGRFSTLNKEEMALHLGMLRQLACLRSKTLPRGLQGIFQWQM